MKLGTIARVNHKKNIKLIISYTFSSSTLSTMSIFGTPAAGQDLKKKLAQQKT
jgi:hypothetical protein